MALRLNVDTQSPSDRTLVLAAEVIQAGGVIVYPTDTLYGLGANAWNVGAAARVARIKKRPGNKPVLVLVHAPAAALGLTDELTDAGNALIASFWPGPLTLVFRSGAHVPASVTGGTGKIGVRVPANNVCVRLGELSGCPLISTSANISGEPAGGSVQEIERSLGPGVDLFIDGGILPASLPSSIVDVSESVPRLIREGAIAFEDLKRCVPTLLR